MSRLLLFGIASILGCLAELVTVVSPETRLTKRVMFVVDVSGSMKGDKFSDALAAVEKIAAQPVDELEIAVLAFNAGPTRWEGIPEPDKIPFGWAAMPSEAAPKVAQAFLCQLGAEGDTAVIPALKQALNEQRSDLSIILVTDGIFQQESEDQILAALEAGQKAREEQKLGRAVLYTYGVGSEAQILKKLAEVSKGGYFHERPTPVPPSDKIQGSVR